MTASATVVAISMSESTSRERWRVGASSSTEGGTEGLVIGA